MINISKSIFFILLFLYPFSLIAQQDDTGNWMMYFGTNKISDQFSVHTEIQYRDHTLTPNNIEQLLLRTFRDQGKSDTSFYIYDTVFIDLAPLNQLF